MAHAGGWTKRKQHKFLVALRQTANVTAAAELAGVSRSHAYQQRRSDGEFRQAWDDAIEAAVDELEEELRRRALHGVEQPVFFGGKECGRVRTYNDALGMFLLRARRGDDGDGKGKGKAARRDKEAALAKTDPAAVRVAIEGHLKRLRARQRDRQKVGEPEKPS